MSLCVHVYEVRVCVCACVRACLRACVIGGFLIDRISNIIRILLSEYQIVFLPKCTSLVHTGHGQYRAWSLQGVVNTGRGPYRAWSLQGVVSTGCGQYRAWSLQGVVPAGRGQYRVWSLPVGNISRGLKH